MRRRKNKEKIEEVIQVKIRDIQEARKRMIKYILPAIIVFFIILFLFAFFAVPAMLKP
jgi:signal peptidase I